MYHEKITGCYVGNFKWVKNDKRGQPYIGSANILADYELCVFLLKLTRMDIAHCHERCIYKL